jgi:MFS family permease
MTEMAQTPAVTGSVKPEPPEQVSGGRALMKTTSLRWLEMLANGLGRFSLMPVLGVVLVSQDRSAGPAAVGAGLFTLTAASGLAAVPFNRFLSRARYATALAGGMLLPALGFGLLPYVHHAPAVLGLLLIAGLGISLHAVFTPLLAAEVINDNAGRHRMYSLFQIAGNAVRS